MGRSKVNTVYLAKHENQAKAMAKIAHKKRMLKEKRKHVMFKPLIRRGTATVLPIHQINKMRRMFEEGHATVRDLSSIFGISLTMARNIVFYRTNILDHREKSLIEMQNDGEIRAEPVRE